MEIKIDQVKNIAYIKLSGVVDEEDFFDAFNKAVSAEKYKKGMARLWDLTEVNLSALDARFIPQLAGYSLKFPKGICDVKVAFVVTKTKELGLTRMFQIYSEESAKSQVRIFSGLDEAENWLME
jgi:hypothetical protein